MKRVLLTALCALYLLTAAPGFSALAEKAATPTYTSGDFTYIILESGAAQIVDWEGDAAELSIPASLDGYRVTSISECAFYGNQTLKSVVMPGSLREICENAFEACVALERVTLNDGLLRIGDFAFQDCEGLLTISLPDSIEAIGENPFRGCANLYRISVSSRAENLVTLDGVLFSRSDRRLVCYPMGFQALSYAVPAGTRQIGAWAFGGALYLESLALPESVSAIGSEAFNGCNGLRELSVPIRVTAVSADATSGVTLRLEGGARVLKCVFPAGIAVNAA